MKNNNKRQSGFSLVELSVVLAVIGLTLSGALVIATKKTIADKIEETNFKMDKIETAIEAFLAIERRLPCVADGSLAKTDANFGREGGDPAVNGDEGQCALSNFDSATIGGGHSRSVYYGVVPTRTLRIPDEYMYDGWGRRFTYVVDARFAISGEVNGVGINPFCGDQNNIADPRFSVCFERADGNPPAASPIIIVRDSSGQDRTRSAIYVLMSHGENGRAAWPNLGGTQLAAPADADEIENAGANDDTVLVQRDETITFDDIVRYRTKWQIMEDAGLINDPNLCLSALQVEEDDDGNACDGLVELSPEQTNCRDLAGQVRQWCLDM